MTNFNQISFVLWLLIVCFADSAAAMTVYLNDGSEIEAQSVWKDGEKVYVRINTELCLDFPASEVNAVKTVIPNKPQERAPKIDKGARASAPAQSGDIMDELVEVAGHRRDFNDLFGRGGHGEIEQILADTLSPALAEKSFKRCLERKLDSRELAEVLAWYKSPVGRKVVEADSVWDFNRQEKAAAYAGRDSVPGFKERLNLVGQIVKLTGSSEMETKLTRNIMQNMMNAIPADYPDAREIKQRIKDEIPTLGMNREKHIQNWAYNYRDLSMNELREYLKFLRSDAGKKYISAVRVANDEIFRKVAVNIEKEFRTYVRR